MSTRIRLSEPRLQYLELRPDLDAAIGGVLVRGVFTPDEQVAAFEEEFSNWVGVPFAVGLGSGSAALTLALHAIGVGPDDHVASAANLDISAVAPISRVGAVPVWVDIDPATQNISPAGLEQAITDRTRAIIVVHAHGVPAPMDDIDRIARSRGIPVIEDATLGPGSLSRGRPIGSIGTIGCFSMAPTKPLGALGNAGVLVTDDASIAARVRTLANYGFAQDSVDMIRSGVPLATFRYEAAGVNATMDELQAAVLRVKLRSIDRWAERRRAHVEVYRNALAGLAGGPPATQLCLDGDVAAPRSFVIRHPERDRIGRLLDAEGISTALHYVPPIHIQPPFGDETATGSLPVTERVADELLCLPVAGEIPESQIQLAAEATRHIVESIGD